MPGHDASGTGAAPGREAIRLSILLPGAMMAVRLGLFHFRLI
jgi:hypothetical protein